jgi:hypothetical protein
LKGLREFQDVVAFGGGGWAFGVDAAGDPNVTLPNPFLFVQISVHFIKMNRSRLIPLLPYRPQE